MEIKFKIIHFKLKKENRKTLEIKLRIVWIVRTFWVFILMNVLNTLNDTWNCRLENINKRLRSMVYVFSVFETRCFLTIMFGGLPYHTYIVKILHCCVVECCWFTKSIHTSKKMFLTTMGIDRKMSCRTLFKDCNLFTLLGLYM